MFTRGGLHESFRQQVTSVMNMLTVAAAQFSDDTAIRYVLPVLWMTSCLPTVGQAKATLTDRILNQGHHRGRSVMFTIALFGLRFLRATNKRICKYFLASLINLAVSQISDFLKLGSADFVPPFPQIDIIGVVVIVWRVRGKIIRSVLCNIVCNN